MKKLNVPQILKKMNEIFESHGHKAYLVGGAVRDMIMGKTPSDLDITTDALPEEVVKMFSKVIPTGIAHGTVTVHFMNEEIEVTTFRIDSDYSDGRHPDKIFYTDKLEEDLSRRDFTINSIAVSLKDGNIIDPFGGIIDIKKKIIRTVGKPHDRFMEDGLRPVRAIRFVSKLNFSIHKDTYKEISKNEILEKVKSISIERFRDELEKILKSDKPSVALKMLEETGILDIFIPEFSSCRNCVQSDYRKFHDFDVLDHLFYACDGAPKNKLNVRIAALFHDIGKPVSKKTDKSGEFETITFYGHDKTSEKLARDILFRLKFSNAFINNVVHLIANHMFNYESNWNNSAVRRFLVKVKYENIEDLFDLRLADIYGMHNEKIDIKKSPVVKNLNEFSDRIEKIHEEKNALSIKNLAINGNDLIDAGITPGKEIGFILKELFEAVLDDPELNTREKLLDISSRIWMEKNQ